MKITRYLVLAKEYHNSNMAMINVYGFVVPAKWCILQRKTNLNCAAWNSVPLIICNSGIFWPLTIAHPGVTKLLKSVIQTLSYLLRHQGKIKGTLTQQQKRSSHPCENSVLLCNIISMNPPYVELIKDLSITGGRFSGLLGKSSL